MAFQNRKNWTGDDSALVMPYEGTPLTVEATSRSSSHRKTSPPSGNNKPGEFHELPQLAELDTDWHVALVADPGEAEERAVVVEPTPRTKRNNAGWTPDLAAGLAVRRKPSAPRDESNAATCESLASCCSTRSTPITSGASAVSLAMASHSSAQRSGRFIRSLASRWSGMGGGWTSMRSLRRDVGSCC